MRRNAGTFRARAGRRVLDMKNAIRKVAVSVSKGGDWGFQGYEFENIEDGSTTVEGEGDEPIPVFQGIGIYARPAGSKAEGVMLHIGCEADHPVLSAIRDEQSRLAYVDEFGDIEKGDIAIFNGLGSSRVIIKADGSISIDASSSININGPAITVSNGGLAEPSIKASTYLSAEATMLATLASVGTAIAADALVSPGLKATGGPLAAAIAAYLAASPTYQTTILKGE